MNQAREIEKNLRGVRSAEAAKCRRRRGGWREVERGGVGGGGSEQRRMEVSNPLDVHCCQTYWCLFLRYPGLRWVIQEEEGG